MTFYFEQYIRRNLHININLLSPSSRGLGHGPFTPVTGVRIPMGTPISKKGQTVLVCPFLFSEFYFPFFLVVLFFGCVLTLAAAGFFGFLSAVAAVFFLGFGLGFGAAFACVAFAGFGFGFAFGASAFGCFLGFGSGFLGLAVATFGSAFAFVRAGFGAGLETATGAAGLSSSFGSAGCGTNIGILTSFPSMIISSASRTEYFNRNWFCFIITSISIMSRLTAFKTFLTSVKYLVI